MGSEVVEIDRLKFVFSPKYMQDKIVNVGESHICTKKYEKKEKREKRVMTHKGHRSNEKYEKRVLTHKGHRSHE